MQFELTVAPLGVRRGGGMSLRGVRRFEVRVLAAARDVGQRAVRATLPVDVLGVHALLPDAPESM